MSDEPNAMSCQQFQTQLPGLIASGSDVERHSHIQSCNVCRALLQDLVNIAEAARQLFPLEVRPSDIWDDSDGDLEQGIPAILPKIPNRGSGSAAASLEFESE